MTTVRVPSRTHAGHFYDVSIGIDGTLICTCPASFNHLECWHQAAAFDEMEWRGIEALIQTKTHALFWEKVDHHFTIEGCWLWTGAHDEYGHFGIGSVKDNTRRTVNAHVYAFEFINGKPENQVNHYCDTKLCCRPSHMYDGSRAQNQADALERGQRVRRFTPSVITDIRRQLKSGISQREIACEYGTSQQYISTLLRKEEMMTNEASKALVPVVVQPSTALLPTSRELDLVERAAAMIYAGGVSLPKELNTKEKVAAVMLYGLELGLRPMTAIQHLFLINGKLGASAQVMAGMCMAKEPDISFPVERLDAQVCTMRMIRPSRHLNEVMTVTWEQIKRAGLDRNPMNQQYPEDRLRYHVVKRLCRLVAPDLINNMDEGVPVAGLGGGSWREDKPLDDSDLYNEGDAPLLPASVAAPAPPEKPVAAPDEVTAVYMQLLDARGKDAAQAVMAWALETFRHAAGKNGHLDRSKLTSEEQDEVVAEMRRYIRTGMARCPEDGHEATINPDTALMECSTCGYAMEQPEPVAVGLF